MSVNTVKERPILFAAPMVLALLAGRKTQTRRMVKPQPVWVGEPMNLPDSDQWCDGCNSPIIRCPYGQSGDRLWVRETLAAPRWASRITLEITGVWVERLAEITEWDAYAEGISKSKTTDPNPCASYRAMWDSLNCPPGFRWQDNPWVWKICFKVLAKDAK